MKEIIWTIVAGGIAAGGIVLCATQQGAVHGQGLRFAMIMAAIGFGAAGGALFERLTRSRRRRRSPSRKTRRRNRKVAFIFSGIIVAVCAISVYLAEQTWLIVSAAIVILAATWLWYTLEARGLTQAATPASVPRDPEAYRRKKPE